MGKQMDVSLISPMRIFLYLDLFRKALLSMEVEPR